ncbi:MAG: aminotransferase class V-fold PLP-dependent enzyme [Cytophagales bacterium]|nr:aminotransferase class V-fold PLP-dependent enzyme [Bernardetiaceae bacterium]MDW8211521.1 aminotransferase class V-fold PLP-dependent enzyme [Cytophagales bacterium]
MKILSVLRRRNFLKQAAALSLYTPLSSIGAKLIAGDLHRAIELAGQKTTEEIIRDESFWYQIKQAFTVSSTILNLNNGGVSPHPRVVQEAVERYNRFSNEAPSYYMWRILDAGREPLRARLAELAGCLPEEIAIQRNATEALETVIFGLRLQKGDEVVLARQDYPSMINAWRQREKRDGIVLRYANLQLPSEDKEAIIRQYTSLFSAKTKVVHITHIINWSGQIIPVRPIAQAAHARGIEVIVDGAHSFGLLNFRIPDLEADYFGTSLHKWLTAPFGSGMLYVKKEKIAQLYPLFAAPDPESNDIRKFEHLGTRPFANEQAIGQAIDFHLMIGAERKALRLHYLKNYWAEQVVTLPKVRLHTSLNPEFGCAIGLFSVEGKTPAEIDSALFNQYKIHTVAIEWENIKGVRVTPNVYTTTHDLDRLVNAIHRIASL